MSPQTAAAVAAGNAPKGEVLGTARLAGIQAAKQTAGADPARAPALAERDRRARPASTSRPGVVELVSEVAVADRTGVEMEAMVAAAASPR